MSIADTRLDEATFAYVRDLIREQAAIALAADKGYLVHTRLTPLAQERGHRSIRELVTELRTSTCGELQSQVVEAMTTNETSFFRDIHPFRALQNVVLPALIEARQAKRTLTIWSGACSTGQEPYSIAMLLAEHFPKLRSWQSQILATDLDRQVLARAACAEYSDLEVGRGLSPTALEKHFERRGTKWKLKAELRKAVTFSQHNLINPLPAGWKLDVVFLRNVLIYFAPETKRRVLEHVKRCLAPDGVLFLGGAESTLGIDDQWQRTSHGATSTYRLCERGGL